MLDQESVNFIVTFETYLEVAMFAIPLGVWVFLKLKDFFTHKDMKEDNWP